MRMTMSTKKRKTPLVSRAADSARIAPRTDGERSIYDHGVRPQMQSAVLKDGRYIKPYTLLEIEQLWAGQCDDRTRSRRPPATSCYHIMIDGGFAACRPFRPRHRWVCYNAVLIGEKSLIPIDQRNGSTAAGPLWGRAWANETAAKLGQVPTQRICRRNGCLQVYEAYLG